MNRAQNLKLIKTYFALILLFLSSNYSFAQPVSSCTNADFEMNNFSNWTGGTGSCCPISIAGTAIVSGRHTIMSGAGTDPYSLGTVTMVAPGGLYSARLGNDNTGSEAERLRYSIAVTPQNQLFIYRYAVVLEDPAHSPAEQPRFEIRVFDQNGTAVQCGTYIVSASGSIPGFQNNGSYRYKNWTTVGIDLSAYTGTTVTIEYQTGDCALGAHFGYAYIDCFCSPLSITSNLCVGFNGAVSLNAPIGFESYLWSTGDTTQNLYILNPVIGTNYSVTMTSVTGCQVTLNTVLTPSYTDAAFNFNSLFCTNYSQFLDSSTTNGLGVVSWNWEFGDGAVSNVQNPYHQYAGPGTYNVTLIAENDIGCIDTITQQVTIHPEPQSNFVATNSCVNYTSSFTDASTVTTGTVTNWYWDFGDGILDSNASSTTHIYNLDGFYTVQLISVSNYGCVDTSAINIQVFPSPTAEFVTTEVCKAVPANFTDASVNPTGTIAAWDWDFGDNSNSNIAMPIHAYGNAGTYAVQLIVTSSNGCIDTVMHPFTVHDIPFPYFNASDVCLNGANSFINLSTIANDSITGTEWIYGDGNVGNLSTDNHVYGQPGIYTVKLITTSAFGCIDSTEQTVTVYKLPEVHFGVDYPEHCEPHEVNVSDLSLQGDTTITNWLWTFGDGNTSQLQNPWHAYPNDGSYEVGLTVTDMNGCVGNSQYPDFIKVWPTPKAGFTPDPDRASILYPLIFINDQSQEAEEWHYDFGDRTYSSDPQPDHAYSAAGTYRIMQIVSNHYQCRDTAYRQIIIDNESTFFIPDAFTPNDDGSNDYFIGFGFLSSKVDLKVFNRWGELLYNNEGNNVPWDGKFKGEHVQGDVYVYKMVAYDYQDQPHEYIGKVTLVR